MMALLSAKDYDFSDTVIISVGCARRKTGPAFYGDVVLCHGRLRSGAWVTSDRPAELQNPARGLTWFPDDTSFLDYKCKMLNPELYEKAEHY